MRNRLGLQDKIVFLYGGNMGVAQDMDNILRLIAGMRDDKDIFFLLVGGGSDAGRVEREIARRGLANVAMHTAVPPTEYLAIVAECDVGLITLRRDFKTQNFPGKMLSYMQMGKPMVASVNPGSELKAILHGHEAGLVCDNGEDEVFRQYALKLARDKELRLRMGSNAQRLLKERFDVKAAARQILGHFGQDRGTDGAGK
jgi:glycosyltransferase involved in cell wall biosynthesis